MNLELYIMHVFKGLLFVSVFTTHLFYVQDTLDELVKAEAMSDRLKTQLNDLCRFSREMATQSERVSALIKDYNRSEKNASNVNE